ncbi:hypothetical protein C7M84_020864 [Penaeus vannamei]|uniref:G-protein coupled receptors family 1 profile domain-containing protein n=1 Tax=Penaeus vannamei TaxID=6689 RepID=A0A423SAX6_PENVA|nr:hypothetical protein C7M84_020864 [Penaeus vannamei]
MQLPQLSPPLPSPFSPKSYPSPPPPFSHTATPSLLPSPQKATPLPFPLSKQLRPHLPSPSPFPIQLSPPPLSSKQPPPSSYPPQEGPLLFLLLFRHISRFLSFASPFPLTILARFPPPFFSSFLATLAPHPAPFLSSLSLFLFSSFNPFSLSIPLPLIELPLLLIPSSTTIPSLPFPASPTFSPFLPSLHNQYSPSLSAMLPNPSFPHSPLTASPTFSLSPSLLPLPSPFLSHPASPTSSSSLLPPPPFLYFPPSSLPSPSLTQPTTHPPSSSLPPHLLPLPASLPPPLPFLPHPVFLSPPSPSSSPHPASPPPPPTKELLYILYRSFAVSPSLSFKLHSNFRWGCVPRYFLTSMAFADLLKGLVVVPLSVYPTLYHCFPYPRLLCAVQAILLPLLHHQAALTLSLLALDRYCCLLHPSSYQNHASRPVMERYRRDAAVRGVSFLESRSSSPAGCDVTRSKASAGIWSQRFKPEAPEKHSAWSPSARLARLLSAS